MKTTFKFIIAAMAAVSVFASCQKEMNIETANNTNDAVRVISAQFDNSTKASLNGLKPSFENNDEILVSNSEKSEVRTVSVSGSTVSFTTTLSGALTAIYPAAAAVLNSAAANAPIAASNNIKVLTSQSGLAKDAIIAKAEITAESTSATFNVQTALFAIEPPTEATSFTITSLKTVENGVARTGTAVAINTEGEDAAAKCVINVTVPTGGTAYVSLVPGVNLSDLSFEYTTDATHGAMKGIPVAAITKAGKADQTAANTKYTINDENWHQYVVIGGKKWATENVGATETNPNGYYFFWSGIEGYVYDNSKWVTASNSTQLSGGFAEANTPYYVSTHNYSKYNNVDNKTVLDLMDDAAYANWGGAWRMPTGYQEGYNFGGEVGEMISATNCTTESNVFKFTDTNNSSNVLSFPATGYGEENSLTLPTHLFFWCSTPVDNVEAWALWAIAEWSIDPSHYDRNQGHPVRPISD